MEKAPIKLDHYHPARDLNGIAPQKAYPSRGEKTSLIPTCDLGRPHLYKTRTPNLSDDGLHFGPDGGENGVWWQQVRAQNVWAAFAEGGRAMAEPAEDVIARIAVNLAAGNGPLNHEDGVEFARALVELSAQIERAADILRQLVELSNPQAFPGNLHLTQRELEMLSHLAEGRSNGEIAKLCWVSENTVKFHLKNLFRKLQVRDRGQAMMIARAMRWHLDMSRPKP